MARGSSVALQTELTAEDQAALDQMRADDAAVDEIEPQAEVVADAPVDGGHEDTPTDQPQERRQQMVPHQALKEERERRQELERRLEAAEKARQTLDERTNLILQRMNQQQAPQPQQPPPPQLPDIQTHPVEHLLGQIALRDNVLSSVVQQLNQRNQGDQQASQITALQQHTMALEQEYRRANPEYDAAVEHMANVRLKQMELAGLNPVQRRMEIAREAQELARVALQRGENPGEFAFKMATDGYGYKPKAADPDPAPAERITQAQRGQQQDGRSLSTVRGAGPRPLTAQKLLEMSDAEFLKTLETPDGRDLMGA